MRVCLDSNVLVSAFATRGLAADVLRATLAEHELLVPEVVLVEVRRVLERKIRLPAATIAAIDQLLRSQTLVPKPPSTLKTPVRDPDDAWVLASAVAGGADILVTGDADLLAAAKDASLPVVSPRSFWERLRGGRRGS